MKNFKLYTMAESSELEAPPSSEGSFSEEFGDAYIMEAAADVAEHNMICNRLLIEGYISNDPTKYTIIQESVLENIWEKIKQFFDKLIAAVKSFMDKAKMFFARILRQTDKWYEMIRPRYEAAKKINPKITRTMPNFKIENDNYKKESDECIKVIDKYAEMLESDSSILGKITRKGNYKTPYDRVAEVLNVAANFARLKTDKKDKPAGFDEYIKFVEDSTKMYEQYTTTNIEEIAAQMMYPGSKNVKDALAFYETEKLYVSKDPVKQDFMAAQTEPFADLLASGKTISKNINAAIASFHKETIIAKQQWNALRSKFLAYISVTKVYKDTNVIDTKDSDVKKIIHVVTTFINRYASYVVKLFSILSKAANGRCRMLIKTVASAQKHGMNLIMEFVKAAEEKSGKSNPDDPNPTVFRQGLPAKGET